MERCGFPLPCESRSSPGWTRTNNPPVNSRMLCQLSYRGTVLSGRNCSRGMKQQAPRRDAPRLLPRARDRALELDFEVRCGHEPSLLRLRVAPEERLLELLDEERPLLSSRHLDASSRAWVPASSYVCRASSHPRRHRPRHQLRVRLRLQSPRLLPLPARALRGLARLVPGLPRLPGSAARRPS
jgi:hypothetical protein